LKKIYGLIGYPVKHSLSPAMHNAAFKALNINAEYKLFELKPEEVEGFIKSLESNNIFGLNITVPYKEKALDLVTLDQGSFYLRQIKAINTIVRSGAVLKGFNTDIPGFQKDLKENIDPADKRAAILGAGGAARAVAYVLANTKAKDIHIYDIDRNKSHNIVDMIKSLFADYPISAVDNIGQLDIRNKDLLINTTPVGLSEKDPCLVEQEMLHKNLFVYDLIYNPSETKLLALAKKNGLRYSNGLNMLLYQGMLSFSHWMGEDAPVEVMRKALTEAMVK
jgi:shikimate dehydrogenase